MAIAETAIQDQLKAVKGLAGGLKVKAGRQSVTGTATAIVTGLSTVTAVVASVESVGAGAGDPAVVIVAKNAAAGKIDITVKQDDFTTNATNAVQVHWIAAGT